MENKLSDKNKTKFYDFIVQFEKEISSKFGHYNLNNKEILSYCNDNKILLGPSNKTNNGKIHQYKYFILWDDAKPTKYKNIKDNDSAHNLLRHLRNSMAHGYIVMENRQKFSLSDYNGNDKQSMKGKILSTIFFELISRLLQTYTK